MERFGLSYVGFQLERWIGKAFRNTPKEQKLALQGNTYYIRINYKVMWFGKVGFITVETGVVF